MANYQSAYSGAQIDDRLGKAGTAIQGVKVNGTEVTPDAQKKVNISAATSAELTAEQQARIAADGVLQTAIDGKASSSALSAEVSAREAADGALQTAVAGKQATLVSGTNIKTINNQSILGAGNISVEGGTGNYNELTNKPQVNSVELSGNKSLNDLGIQSKIDASHKLPAENVSGLANVATSGDYNDLTNKPTIPSVSGKADKVSGATSGDFAGLDANGNLVDSGKKASDFLTEHQSLAAYRTSADQDTIDNTKVDKVSGKGLSTNDYTTAEKNKLAGIAAGAEVNPTIDTTIDAQSVNTEVAGAKAVYDYVQDAVPIPKVSVADSVASQELAPNTLYFFASRTSDLVLTLGTPIADIVNEYHLFLPIGATLPTVTPPAGVTWDGGSFPTLAVNKTYEVSILENYGFVKEW